MKGILYVLPFENACTEAMKILPTTYSICDVHLIDKKDRPIWLVGVPTLAMQVQDGVLIYCGSECIAYLRSGKGMPLQFTSCDTDQNANSDESPDKKGNEGSETDDCEDEDEDEDDEDDGEIIEVNIADLEQLQHVEQVPRMVQIVRMALG